MSNNFDVKSNNSTQKQLTNSKLQIEEMCRLICNACEFGCGFEGECDGGYDYKKCNNAIETALALYNAGYRKQNKWISVKDRLPSECGKYLGCTEKGTIIIVRYYTTDGGFFGYHNLCTITHWMPLPEAPKMKGGE